MPRWRRIILNIWEENPLFRSSCYICSENFPFCVVVLFFLECKYNKITHVIHLHGSSQEKNIRKNITCKNLAVKAEIVFKCCCHYEIYLKIKTKSIQFHGQDYCLRSHLKLTEVWTFQVGQHSQRLTCSSPWRIFPQPRSHFCEGELRLEQLFSETKDVIMVQTYIYLIKVISWHLALNFQSLGFTQKGYNFCSDFHKTSEGKYTEAVISNSTGHTNDPEVLLKRRLWVSGPTASLRSCSY